MVMQASFENQNSNYVFSPKKLFLVIISIYFRPIVADPRFLNGGGQQHEKDDR